MEAMNLKSAGRQGQDAARQVKNHPALSAVARFGYVVMGLLNILLGWLVLQIALGFGGEEASNAGALSNIAQAPGGRVALWVAVAGLVALGLWRLLQAVVGPEWSTRIKGAVLAVVYLSLAWTASTFARGDSTSEGDTATDVTATALEQPAGVALVVVAGLVIVGVGVGSVFLGVTRRFTKQLEAGAEAGKVGSAIVVVGVLGYVARGVAFAVLGGLVVWAALTRDPEKAAGLDAAFRYIGQQPFGAVLLVVIGVGLGLYGVFCLGRARYADAS